MLKNGMGLMSRTLMEILMWLDLRGGVILDWVMVHILVMHEFLSIMMLIENGRNLPNYCQKSQLEEWGCDVAISSNGNYLAVGSQGTGDLLLKSGIILLSMY